MTQPMVSETDRWVEMAENQVLALHSRHLKITCFKGRIWLTDGMGGEDLLSSGQQLEWHTCGKTCIQAFAPSKVGVSTD